MSIITIPANGQQHGQVQGTYLYVKSATGAFQLLVTDNNGHNSNYNVTDNNFQIKVDAGIRSVELFDRSGASNDIDISGGYNQFIPRNDGQLVQLMGGAKVPITSQARVCDSTGAYWFSPECCSHVLNWSGGLLQYEQVTDPVTGFVFRQTMAYDGSGNLLTVTAWVKQ